jgi:hypothetical protein
MAFQIRRAHRFLPSYQDQIALTISTSAKNGKVPAAWTKSSPGNTHRRLPFPSVNHSAYSVREWAGSCFSVRVWPSGLAAN